jgi:hypothetical protein
LPNEKIKYFWCDGVSLPKAIGALSIQQVNKARKIITTAWVGQHGEENYELMILLGRKALSRYVRGLSLDACVPDAESPNWLTVDLVNRKIILQLH